MVVISNNNIINPTSHQLQTSPEKNIRQIELPTIDLSSSSRSEVSRLIVKACEEFGFFKVVNHGVPKEIIEKIENESYEFFNKSVTEKQLAGPANPFGYGSKKIGLNGDVGEIEYLLFNANSPSFSPPTVHFSCALSGYIEAVREVACEILELMAEGLWVKDTSLFSRLITTVDNDSLLRINHYPPIIYDSATSSSSSSSPPRVGIGEHTDPQILTLLRSNDVSGLQISPEEGVWVPVPPDPAAFFVNVGDLLKAMTNGRFMSVRHRAMVSSEKGRISIGFFGGPPLNTIISCPKELINNEEKNNIYRMFSWAEYKEATYSLRLRENRLNLFLN